MRAAVFLFVLLLSAVCAMAADLTGAYKGTWSGNNGGGDITMTFSNGDNASSKAAVSFTYNGEDIACRVTSVKVNGSLVQMVYDFDIDGNRMQTTMTGQLKNKTLEGSYKTKSLSDGSEVDEGAWKAATS
jgi:hypothetical protein